MNKHIIIPARLNSKRLPEKVISDISGKTMLEHVYCKASHCEADSITIATDSTKIAEIANRFGAQVCMTKSSHQSGTERIAEAVRKLGIGGDDIVINVQGDEPLLPRENILHVSQLLDDTGVNVATLCERIRDKNDILDPNVVKVIFNKMKEAIYFSRAPIPWNYDTSYDGTNNYYRHIGLYAYRADFLLNYSLMKSSPIEKNESLEQLRVIWNGFKITIDVSLKTTPCSVDTLSDLERVRKLL